MILVIYRSSICFLSRHQCIFHMALDLSINIFRDYLKKLNTLTKVYSRKDRIIIINMHIYMVKIMCNLNVSRQYIDLF